jgi:hypothetical protein
VAIAMDRSIDMIVGLLGILKSGGAYLPIDPAYPKERLEFVLADTEPMVLRTSSACQPLLPRCDAQLLVIDTEASDLASESTENLEAADRSDSLTYVIYTSGSTGLPKGCQATHANVARLFSSTEPWFGFGPEDVWTFFLDKTLRGPSIWVASEQVIEEYVAPHTRSVRRAGLLRKIRFSNLVANWIRDAPRGISRCWLKRRSILHSGQTIRAPRESHAH